MTCCSGLSHTITLADNGAVYAFGRNNCGQLGIGNHTYYTSISTPTHIPNLPKIKEVACGGWFTVCVDEEGGMWSFGYNYFGQLGLGNTTDYNTPQKIPDIPLVQSVACGVCHTLFITNDAKLWSIGMNNFGQLCLGNKENQITPKQTSFSNVSKISCGENYSLFQNTDGEIFGCGYNVSGQTGLGHQTHPQIQVTLIPNLSNIFHFCCGNSHSLFLDSEGRVFIVGYRGAKTKDSNLYQIPDIPPIQTISCVSFCSYLIDFDGNLWSFGLNDYGQLGLGDETNRSLPTKVNCLTNIRKASSGCVGFHSLVQDSNNKIFVLGNNLYGQIGLECTKTLIPKELDSKYFSIWGEFIQQSRAKSARK